MNRHNEDTGSPVDARHGQGIAVGSHITQHNYFMNSATPTQADESRPRRVFISSASGALAPYRKAAVEVCHRLGYTPVYMEEFDPQRPPPEEVCRREVESCDVFVLLLAHRYGSRPPGQQQSYTELEYDWAITRPQIELLPFVVDPAFAWPPPDIDHGAEAMALAQLVARVRSRHEVKVFNEVGTFREDLIVALKRHEPGRPNAQRQNTPAGETQHYRVPPVPPAFHAMPTYVGSAPFTGRAQDLLALDEWAGSADPIMVVEAIGGTGKSALTWEWILERAPVAVDGLAGRMWWSFYDGSASMTRFLREALAYTTGRPMKEIRQLNREDLAEEVLTALRDRPYLLVLDGFERLLTSYHRFDPSKLRDEEVEPEQRSLIEPHADDIVRRLTDARPSKILISTRLMPTALQSRFGRQLAGVRHLRLPGLTDADTLTLLGRLGVYGSQQAVAGFFQPLGNHPLLIGVVAGLVNDYRPEPGGFDRWLADPYAGGAFNVPGLDLSQRRTHILAAALAGLRPGPRRLLGWISVLSGAVSWTTLDAINPFRSGRSKRDVRARAELDAALKNLEDRGLLWWDRSSNSYDLHPIIRAYAYDQLKANDRVEANGRVRDHFRALPAEDPARATSVEDLTQSITIFRALVGAGQLQRTEAVWRSFGDVLLVDLGAYATVVELLTPLAVFGTRRIRSELAAAYHFMNQYDKAIHQNTSLLDQSLEAFDLQRVLADLTRLTSDFHGIAAYARASRCVDLQAAIHDAVGVGTGGSEYANRALRAILEGRTGDAHYLLNRAKTLHLDNDPWLGDMIASWELYLALMENQPSIDERLSYAIAQVHSLMGRRRLTELRYELFIQEGKFTQALTAAQEHEQLGRRAGIDVAPTVSAFLLAKLGMIEEATAATEDALARLPRIHTAQRPHRYLARALLELGRHAEAAEYARAAYRQAWADGPPNCHHWDLRSARQLLKDIGEPIPDLPVTDPTDVKIPLEDKVRSFIAKLQVKGQHGGADE